MYSTVARLLQVTFHSPSPSLSPAMFFLCCSEEAAFLVYNSLDSSSAVSNDTVDLKWSGLDLKSNGTDQWQRLLACVYVCLYPIAMATDSILVRNESHARRVISMKEGGFQ